MSHTIGTAGGDRFAVDFGEILDSSVPVICGECCRGSYVVMSGSRALCYLCGHEIAPRDLDPDPDVVIVWGENGSLILARDAESELDR